VRALKNFAQGMGDKLRYRLASLSPVRWVWFLAAVFSFWAVADLMLLKVSGGIARTSYDTLVRARVWAAPADPRIVIIDIDERSLEAMAKEFGRWPWPRDTLATVLDHIEKQQPAAIVWDISFADPDRLSPGGDSAFSAAAQRSGKSHYPVIRLPAANDAKSELTRTRLPQLWLPEPAQSAPVSTQTLAVIAPGLSGVLQGKLGYNNAVPDADGTIRRYSYAETLGDGSRIQSIPASVQRALQPNAQIPTEQQLIAWRKSVGSYPRIPFVDVFTQAEGSTATVPSFGGKIVVIGSTAPALHDIHPTPLSPVMPGVESLATVIDNALNDRLVRGMPAWAQALVAVLVLAALASWAHHRGFVSLAPVLFGVPIALMAISFASLHGSPVFLDLHAPAALALGFVAIVKKLGVVRMDYWLSAQPRVGSKGRADTDADDFAHASMWRRDGWPDWVVWRLIDHMRSHAKRTRLVLVDNEVSWPSKPRWSELQAFMGIVGPKNEIETVLARVRSIHRIGDVQTSAISVWSPSESAQSPREQLAAAVAGQWGQMLDPSGANSSKVSNP
jgi:adenylate cyclase